VGGGDDDDDDGGDTDGTVVSPFFVGLCVVGRDVIILVVGLFVVGHSSAL
jgi:hypothetical protein